LEEELSSEEEDANTMRVEEEENEGDFDNQTT
jgi:hypothetical protein